MAKTKRRDQVGRPSVGAEAWRVGTEDGPAEPRVRASPVVADGVVYLGTGQAGVVAVDAGDGSVRWEHGEMDVFPRSAPAVADGTLFVTNRYEGPVALQ